VRYVEWHIKKNRLSKVHSVKGADPATGKLLTDCHCCVPDIATDVTDPVTLAGDRMCWDCHNKRLSRPNVMNKQTRMARRADRRVAEFLAEAEEEQNEDDQNF
jgi:hypothetical protein